MDTMDTHQYVTTFFRMCVQHFDKDVVVCSTAQWTGVLGCGGHYII